MIETYRGYKIKSARKGKDRTGMRIVEITINGYQYDRRPYFADQLDQVTDGLHVMARRLVDASIERPDAYEWSR